MDRLVADEVLPAGSVAVTEIALSPSANAAAGVALQLPSAATVVASTVPPGSVTRIVSPAVPVPEIFGLAKLVMLSPRVPESVVGSRIAVGAAGALVSTVMVRLVAVEVLPAASVAVTVSALAPVANGTVGVTDHVPPAETVACSTVPPGSVTRMTSPAVPVPEIVGVVSFVRLSPATPESEAESSTAGGADGADVSSVKLTVTELGLRLPAASVTVPTSV